MCVFVANSDIDSDYVHVTADIMALDANGIGGSGGGESSPFVHIKKAPALIVDEENGHVTAAAAASPTATVDMDVVADEEEVWSDAAAGVGATAAGAGGGDAVSGSATGSGGVAAVAAAGPAPAAGKIGESAVDGGVRRALGSGKEDKEEKKEEGEEEEVLPYRVVVTDYAGTVTKGARAVVSC